MYSRDEAKEDRQDVLHETIRNLRFGTCVVAAADGAPQAVHMPFVLNILDGKVTLEGHVARANPIWKWIDSAKPALVMFQGPQAYVHPGWYASKQEHGKVVPTWSYVSVHARGSARLMSDQHALLAHVRQLSDELEAREAKPWSVDDAPSDYINVMLRGIVGLIIEVEALEGVWKLNQHRSGEDRLGMINGLDARGVSDAAELALMMRAVEKRKALAAKDG